MVGTGRCAPLVPPPSLPSRTRWRSDGAFSPSVGRWMSAWLATGRTSTGVITMTSSVSLRFHPLERNSAPSTGTSPSPGVLAIEFSWLFDSSPPITIDSPEPSSAEVSIDRVVSAGMVVPLSCTAPADDSSDTSGRTRMEMRPSARTVGVKARLTP